jgi:hypothetical protein
MSDKSYGWFADGNGDNNENISSSEPQKFLDYEGLKHLWSKINMNDYPNNEILMSVIQAIDETKADKSELSNLTQVQIITWEADD